MCWDLHKKKMITCSYVSVELFIQLDGLALTTLFIYKCTDTPTHQRSIDGLAYSHIHTNTFTNISDLWCRRVITDFFDFLKPLSSLFRPLFSFFQQCTQFDTYTQTHPNNQTHTFTLSLSHSCFLLLFETLVFIVHTFVSFCQQCTQFDTYKQTHSNNQTSTFALSQYG